MYISLTAGCIVCRQNSVRHNLSLHTRFVKVQNEGTGKSSWWTINPDAKTGKSSRRRSPLDPSKTGGRKRGRSKKRSDSAGEAGDGGGAALGSPPEAAFLDPQTMLYRTAAGCERLSPGPLGRPHLPRPAAVRHRPGRLPTGPKRLPPGPKRFPSGPKRFPSGPKWFPSGPKWFSGRPKWFSSRQKWVPSRQKRIPPRQKWFASRPEWFPPRQKRFPV